MKTISVEDNYSAFDDGVFQGRTDVFDDVIKRLRSEAVHLERVGNFNASIYTEQELQYSQGQLTMSFVVGENMTTLHFV